MISTIHQTAISWNTLLRDATCKHKSLVADGYTNRLWPHLTVLL